MSALNLAVQLVHASTLVQLVYASTCTLDLETFPPAVPAQLVRQGSGRPLALGSNLADLGKTLAISGQHYQICPTSCRPRVWVSGTRRLTHRYLGIV